MACGFKAAASTETERGTWSPGRTTPTAGATVIQAAPEVAVNEIGDPLVDSNTVCAAGLGGAVKVNVVALSARVEGGEVTASDTGTMTGAATPVTVSMTDALYDPTGRLVGLTRTVKVPGSFPLSGLAVSHKAVPGEIAVMKSGVPELDLTETFRAAGSVAAPDW